ncbi:MAG: ABC-2 transporter permease [Agathobacter sp.]
MAGLLYKDFVGIKGKKMVLLFLGATLLFLVLRFLFPGTNTVAISGAMRENDAGELVQMTMGDLFDSFLVFVPLFFMACAIFLPSAWMVAILKNDERSGTRKFIRALPLQRNAYIASKYVFIGLAVYLLFSLECIWIIIYSSCAGDNTSAQLIRSMSAFIMIFSGLTLIVAAIELPFYITLGMKKGNLVKAGIMEGMGFLVVTYLLFGNLSIFENYDIFKLVSWCETHFFVMTLITVLTPFICLFLYWLSYRITCRMNRNSEVKIYE